MKCIALFSILVLSLILPETQSICVTRRTDWGQFGSLFTDPLCDVWCRIRRCGKGVCKENPSTTNTANCVCEKCYRDGDGNVIYPDNDGFQQSQLIYDSPTTSSSASDRNIQNGDLYPSQEKFRDY